MKPKKIISFSVEIDDYQVIKKQAISRGLKPGTMAKNVLFTYIARHPVKSLSEIDKEVNKDKTWLSTENHKKTRETSE